MIMCDLDANLARRARTSCASGNLSPRGRPNRKIVTGAGTGAVTGGKQMDGFVHLVRQLLIAAKVPESCIAVDKQILIEKLLRERLYHGACLLLSSAASVDTGDYLVAGTRS